jgi:hypothetical protein
MLIYVVCRFGYVHGGWRNDRGEVGSSKYDGEAPRLPGMVNVRPQASRRLQLLLVIRYDVSLSPLPW